MFIFAKLSKSLRGPNVPGSFCMSCRNLKKNYFFTSIYVMYHRNITKTEFFI